MNKKIFICVFSFLLLSQYSWAHPPTSTNLSYDIISQNLHIDMDHVSRDLRDHYIRRIVVYNNGVEVGVIINNVKQRQPQKSIHDIIVQAAEGDQLSVTAYCSDGGLSRASLIVPITEEDSSETPVEATEVEEISEDDPAYYQKKFQPESKGSY